MPAARSSLQTPRKALTQARRGCEELITAVERAMTGRADAGWEFVSDFQPVADRLLNGLRSLNVPLGDRLEHFRDFVVRERGFTDLGLPLQRDDCGPPALDVALGRTWLEHMRDFRDSLTDIKPTRSRKPGAGRPKDDATVKLWREVQDVYTEVRELLTKDGMARPDVLAQLKALSAAAILNRINENNNHSYPLHGLESGNIKRQVRRSSAWRALHEAEWPARSDEEQADRVVKDRQWALENGLPVGQN